MRTGGDSKKSLGGEAAVGCTIKIVREPSALVLKNDENQRAFINFANVIVHNTKYFN